jgi:hypothetical protein
MIERRPLKSTELSPAPTLEQRISAALLHTLPSTALAELLAENDAGIAAAEQAAEVAKEFAFDPAQSPDLAAARQHMEDAALLVGRLKTLRHRLGCRYQQTYLEEKANEWRGLAADIINEGTALAEEMGHVYADAALKLVDLFTRITDYNTRRDQLYAQRPDRISDQLPDPEKLARNGGGIVTPSLLEATKLFDLNTGKELWPPPQIPLGVTMVAAMPGLFVPRDPDAHSADWWKASERRATAQRVDNDKQALRLREMDKQQTERMNREEREAFTAVHGVVK